MSPLETWAAQPLGVRAWLMGLFALQLVGLLFLRHREARWVLASLAANIVAMVALLRLFGSGHHMSLPHVVFWTPLLGYFYLHRDRIRQGGRIYLTWICALSAAYLVSLLIDYANLAMLIAA